MEGTTDFASLDRSIDEYATKADLETLGTLLADDFVYVHSTGQRHNKSEWLQSLVPLKDRRVRVATNVEVDFHGDIAVAAGDLDVIWNDGRTARNRYVRVYRQVSNSWQVIQQRTVPAHDRE